MEAREPSWDAAPSWKAMTYNIHAGVGTDGELNLPRIAAVIAEERPDFVFLQEVDRGTKRSGDVDQLAVLAQLTGMTEYAFGKAMDYDGGEYGNAILSNYPLTVRHTAALPGNEPRAALFAEADVSSVYGAGQSFLLVAVHLDWQNEQARLQSVADIEAYMPGLTNKPAIIGGDFNDTPSSAVLTALRKHWVLEDLGRSLLTEPSEAPIHQIDYMLYRSAGQWSLKDMYVVPDPLASDHRPLVSVWSRMPHQGF